MGKTRQQANLVSDGFLTTDLSNTKINHTGSLLVSASFSGSGLKVDGNIDITSGDLHVTSEGSFGKIIGDGSELTNMTFEMSDDSTPKLSANLDLNENQIFTTSSVDKTLETSQTANLNFKAISGGGWDLRNLKDESAVTKDVRSLRGGTLSTFNSDTTQWAILSPLERNGRYGILYARDAHQVGIQTGYDYDNYGSKWDIRGFDGTDLGSQTFTLGATTTRSYTQGSSLGGNATQQDFNIVVDKAKGKVYGVFHMRSGGNLNYYRPHIDFYSASSDYNYNSESIFNPNGTTDRHIGSLTNFFRNQDSVDDSSQDSDNYKGLFLDSRQISTHDYSSRYERRWANLIMKPDGRTQMGPAFIDYYDTTDGLVDFQQFFFSDPFLESRIQSEDSTIYWSGADVQNFVADIPGGYGSAWADFAEDEPISTGNGNWYSTRGFQVVNDGRRVIWCTQEYDNYSSTIATNNPRLQTMLFQSDLYIPWNIRTMMAKTTVSKSIFDFFPENERSQLLTDVNNARPGYTYARFIDNMHVLQNGDLIFSMGSGSSETIMMVQVSYDEGRGYSAETIGSGPQPVNSKRHDLIAHKLRFKNEVTASSNINVSNKLTVKTGSFDKITLGGDDVNDTINASTSNTTGHYVANPLYRSSLVYRNPSTDRLESVLSGHHHGGQNQTCYGFNPKLGVGQAQQNLPSSLPSSNIPHFGQLDTTNNTTVDPNDYFGLDYRLRKSTYRAQHGQLSFGFGLTNANKYIYLYPSQFPKFGCYKIDFYSYTTASYDSEQMKVTPEELHVSRSNAADLYQQEIPHSGSIGLGYSLGQVLTPDTASMYFANVAKFDGVNKFVITYLSGSTTGPLHAKIFDVDETNDTWSVGADYRLSYGAQSSSLQDFGCIQGGPGLCTSGSGAFVNVWQNYLSGVTSYRSSDDGDVRKYNVCFVDGTTITSGSDMILTGSMGSAPSPYTGSVSGTFDYGISASFDKDAYGNSRTYYNFPGLSQFSSYQTDSYADTSTSRGRKYHDFTRRLNKVAYDKTTDRFVFVLGGGGYNNSALYNNGWKYALALSNGNILNVQSLLEISNAAVPSTDVNDYLTAVDLKVSNGVVYVNALQRNNSTNRNQYSYIRSNWGFIQKERGRIGFFAVIPNNFAFGYSDYNTRTSFSNTFCSTGIPMILTPTIKKWNGTTCIFLHMIVGTRNQRTSASNDYITQHLITYRIFLDHPKQSGYHKRPGYSNDYYRMEYPPLVAEINDTGTGFSSGYLFLRRPFAHDLSPSDTDGHTHELTGVYWSMDKSDYGNETLGQMQGDTTNKDNLAKISPSGTHFGHRESPAPVIDSFYNTEDQLQTYRPNSLVPIYSDDGNTLIFHSWGSYQKQFLPSDLSTDVGQDNHYRAYITSVIDDPRTNDDFKDKIIGATDSINTEIPEYMQSGSRVKLKFEGQILQVTSSLISGSGNRLIPVQTGEFTSGSFDEQADVDNTLNTFTPGKRVFIEDGTGIYTHNSSSLEVGIATSETELLLQIKR
tara:strand:+ start:5215 stop:9729 length:4515 start_codon:yes stop_codon:yes gene_type:complete